MIESSGFGRGLGVLDLNPTKLKKNLFIEVEKKRYRAQVLLNALKNNDYKNL